MFRCPEIFVWTTRSGRKVLPSLLRPSDSSPSSTCRPSCSIWQLLYDSKHLCWRPGGRIWRQTILSQQNFRVKLHDGWANRIMKYSQDLIGQWLTCGCPDTICWLLPPSLPLVLHRYVGRAARSVAWMQWKCVSSAWAAWVCYRSLPDRKRAQCQELVQADSFRMTRAANPNSRTRSGTYGMPHMSSRERVPEHTRQSTDRAIQSQKERTEIARPGQQCAWFAAPARSGLQFGSNFPRFSL